VIEILLNNFFIWINFLIIIFYNLFLYLKNKEYSLKEFLLQIVFTFIFLNIVVYAAYYFGTNLYQKEYLNGKVNQFVYEEPWTEDYDCSYEECTTDSKGKKTCRTIQKTCQTRHSEEYYLLSSLNSRQNISKYNFRKSEIEFGSHREEVYRSSQNAYSKMKGEGDIYRVYPTKFIPVSEKHEYKNYILGSNETIYKKQKDITLKVLNYPNLYRDSYGNLIIDRVQNYNDKNLENKMNYLAYKYGKSKQINPMIYIVRNASKDYIYAIENIWNGGNKNDSIIILNIDNNGTITWSDSINWSKDSNFKIKAKKFFKGLNINETDKIVNLYENLINKYWSRLSMEKEYGYLKNDLDIDWYIQLFIIIINLLGNIALSRYFLNNKL